MDDRDGQITGSLIVGIFTVIAACISGYFLLLSTDRVENPFISPTVPTNVAHTEVPATVVFQTQERITLHNSLVRPAKYYIDDTYHGIVEALSDETVYLTSFPVKVSFEVVPQTTTQGDPVGDSMSGHWTEVYPGAYLTLANRIGDTFYFYPIITNNTEVDCRIAINVGYTTEQTPGFAEAYETDIGAGYYEWYSDSNVFLYCDDERWYWGIIPNEGGTPLSGIDPESGVLRLTLNP